MHRGVMNRCYNPGDSSYPTYGAIGIRVYAAWHDVAIFVRDLLSILGEKPPGMTLDRINPWGNYEPGNLRWADRKTQNSNRRLITPDFCPPSLTKTEIADTIREYNSRFLTMRTAESKWPIVAPDRRLVTLDELKERCGVKTGSNLRKWIIKQGFSFVLARFGEGNQLCLAVKPDVAASIIERRRSPRVRCPLVPRYRRTHK
jgi:hypothetical protein